MNAGLGAFYLRVDFIASIEITEYYLQQIIIQFY